MARISKGPVRDEEIIAVKYEVVGVFLLSLLGGWCRCCCRPKPRAVLEHRDVVEGLGEVGVAALDARNGKRDELSNEITSSVALTADSEVVLRYLVSIF